MRMGPGLPAETFLGVVWSAAALALIFLGIRLYARIRGPGRIYWDDAFVIFAGVLIVATAGVWQWATPDMYTVLHVSAGQALPGPNFFDTVVLWLRASLVAEIFFYTSLMSVKLSLLFFFKRLGQSVQIVKYVWWPVFALVMISWFVMIGDIQYRCLVGTLEDAMSWCNTPEAIRFTTDTLRANCALDIVTDFLIMILPIYLLWGLKMRLQRKLIFISLFSLTMITMIIAIVRVAGVQSSMWDNGQFDPIYLWMWSAVEPCIATMVACLSAFPQLFVQSSANKPAYKPSESIIQRLRDKASSQSSIMKRKQHQRLAAGDDSVLYSTNLSKTDFLTTTTTTVRSDGLGHQGDSNDNLRGSQEEEGIDLGYVETKPIVSPTVPTGTPTSNAGNESTTTGPTGMGNTQPSEAEPRAINTMSIFPVRAPGGTGGTGLSPPQRVRYSYPHDGGRGHGRAF